MGYLGRRIGLSQDKGDSTPGGAGGAVGGGVLDIFASGYFERQDKTFNSPGEPASGLTATGGIISDYTSGGDVYRAHIFTSSGTFDVTDDTTDFGKTVEYLVVAGGGAGSHGGGGAGGLRTNLSGHPFAGSAFPVTAQSYPVTVGAGGAGAPEPQPSTTDGTPGSNSVFGPITSAGGGGGAGWDRDGLAGGSGGGAGNRGTRSGGTGNSPPQTPSQGYPGGDVGGGDVSDRGGGGGGADGAGGDGPPSGTRAGGVGVQVLIAGPPASDQFMGTPGPSPGGGYFSGGGGGGGRDPGGPGGTGGAGGGGPAAATGDGTAATQSTGGGGGAGGYPTYGGGASGGSGIVVVRYKIGTVATAKATGGVISFYNNKTIHTFTGSGTFATTSDWSATDVEYVVVGGGGGGGLEGFGGGGGAGAYRTGTHPIGAHPVSTTIQVGGGGIRNQGVQNPLPAAYQGTPSYFGTPITSPGGGGGGVDDGSNPYPSSSTGEQGMPGGSGGGNSLDTSGLPSGGTGTGDPFPGTIGATPSNGWGHDGGKGNRSPIGGGGGGGAGAAGATPAPRVGGDGIQLPATFRDPASSVGASGPTSAPVPNGFDASGKYWVAGGGTAGGPAPSYTPTDGIGSAGGGGYWSTPSNPTRPNEIIAAVQNTGSGGAGGPGAGDDPQSGASGIVLIAYPT